MAIPTRTFFPCNGGSNYYGADADYRQNQRYTVGDRGGAYVSGYSHNEDWLGNRKAILLFPSNTIRSTLANRRVTSCILEFYVRDVIGDSSRVVIGTHNYTSTPDVWSNSRVNTNRIQRPDTPVGQVTGFELGTQIGTEFKDGLATGITFGPGPSNTSEAYFAEIASEDDWWFDGPVLIIEHEVANLAPDAPTLVDPVSNAVVDIYNKGKTFRWNHNDQNNDPQAGWKFTRRRPNGSGGYITEWWNGAMFTTTETALPGTGTPPAGALVDGALPIPPGVWPNDTEWTWSVATKDPSGAWSSYAPYRTLYASTPPVAAVVEPTLTAKVPRPTVRWTFSDADGDPQSSWIAQIVESSVYENPNWNADNFLGQTWLASGTGTATAAAPNVDLRNHRTYRAYVKVFSTPNQNGTGDLQPSQWSYATFEVAVPPFAPTILYPINGSVADLGSGFTLEWRNNYFSNVGSQTAFSIRRQVNGGTYEYWDGTSWDPITAGDEPPFLPGAASTYTFRTDEVPNGSNYVFSVAIRDDYNQLSAWSPGVSVLASSAAQVTVLDPSGNTTVTNPTITWTTFDKENDPQQSWQVRVISSSVYGTGQVLDPATATAVWDSGEHFEESTRSVEVPVDLDNGQTYRAYVRVATNGIYSGWSYSEFTVTIIPPATPTATTVVRDDDGAIDIVIQGRDSMLSEDASRCFDGWEAWNNGPDDDSNSSVENAVPFGSSQSRYATNVTSRDANKTMLVRTSMMWPVSPGTQYTGAATLLATLNTPGVNSYVSIEFLDAGQNIVAISSATPISDETAVRPVAIGIAPENATYAALRITYNVVPAANSVHTFFDPVLRPTTGSEWSPGGTLGNTFASVSEVTENRQIRFGQNVPIPVENQRVTIRDEEARIGADMTYAVTIRAVYSNAALVSAPVSIPPARWTSGYLWLSDPLRRGSGRSFSPQSFDAITRPVRQGKFRPIGRPDAVMTTGVRGLREGSFTLVMHDREERQEFQSLSDFSEILLLRIPPDTADPTLADPLGETFYIRFEGDAPEERPLPSRTPHRIITQAWVEQRSPAVKYQWETLENED
jgi:hypothetical protein